MRWKEWPLVLFTLLGQAAAGLAILLLLPLHVVPALITDRSLDGVRLHAALSVLGLLGAAAILSLFHLGRPARAGRALSGTGSSWLSREILAEILFMAATAALAFTAWRASASYVNISIAVLVAAEAIAFVVSMARIYTVPAVPDWNTPATSAAFFATALLLGSMLAALAARGAIPFLSGLAGTAFDAASQKIAFAFAAAAFLLAFLFSPGFGRRVRRKAARVYPPDRSLPFFFAVRISLLVPAIGLWGAAAFRPLAPASLAWIAFAAAVLSEFVGRLVFYSLPDGL